MMSPIADFQLKIPLYAPECSENEARALLQLHMQTIGGDLVSGPWFDRTTNEWNAAVIAHGSLVLAAFKLAPCPPQALAPSA